MSDDEMEGGPLPVPLQANQWTCACRRRTATTLAARTGGRTWAALHPDLGLHCVDVPGAPSCVPPQPRATISNHMMCSSQLSGV